MRNRRITTRAPFFSLRTALAAAFVLGSSFALGCAAEEGESVVQEDELGASDTLDTNTSSFDGTFTMSLNGQSEDFAFKISGIDWAAGSAKIDLNLAKPSFGMTDLLKFSGKVSLLTARCPGCFTIQTAKEPNKKAELFSLVIVSGKAKSLKYHGFAATKIKLTNIKKTPTASKPAALPSPSLDRALVFEGSFHIQSDVTDADFKFTVSNLDWKTLTGRWDAAPTPGSTGASPDVNYIVNIGVSRDLSGDLIFLIKRPKDGSTLATLKAPGSKLVSIQYANMATTNVVVTRVSK